MSGDRFGSRSALLLLCAAVLAPGTAFAQSTVFRVSALALRDPHFYTQIFTCFDFTDNDSFGFSVNSGLADSIGGDSDGDGLLDLSFLLQFMPLAQQQPTNFVAAGLGSCSAPAAGTSCGGITQPAFAQDVALQSAGVCLEPIAGTLRPYTPAVTSTPASCFVSPGFTLTLDLGGVPVTLRDARLAAAFEGEPATTLTDGLLRGFLTEADADATLLPASYPLVGGQLLSTLLPGGDPPGDGNSNCAAHSDKDLHEGQSGWWFYFNLQAVPVDSPFVDGFADGFESSPP